VAVVLVALPLLAAACNGGDGNDRADPEKRNAGPDGGGPQPGQGAARCEDGFTRPGPGTPVYNKALFVIRRTMRVQGDFSVDEMRYFEGPESPPSDKNYLSTVRRWYVKASLAEGPSFRGRWLVEERTFGSGVAAVAPYHTRGFRSPHWTAFQWETVGPAANPRKYPGLPGTWAGSPYDFVTGEPPDEGVPGEALTIPGLPPEVAGCLKGT
jgi:hypothetical protein